MAVRASAKRRMMYFCSTVAGGNFAQNKVITRFFMATTEKYTTVIELNSEQAKRNLDELRKDTRQPPIYAPERAKALLSI